MPEPKPGENRDQYLGRCVPVLIGEGKKRDQAVAVCISMYSESKAKKALSIIDALIEKCGGPGGKPGPCPGGRNGTGGAVKPPGAKPTARKPRGAKPRQQAAKPGKPKKPKVSAKDIAKYKKIDAKNPKPKVSKAQLLSAKISIKKGKLVVSITANPKEALLQLDIVQKIKKKADTLVAAVKEKLPMVDAFRQNVLMAASAINRTYSRVVSQSKKILKSSGSKAVVDELGEGELGVIPGISVFFDVEG